MLILGTAMPSDEKTVPGVKNLGNTCFLNAVLQALASSTATVQHLRLTNSASAIKDTPLASALSSCLSALAPHSTPRTKSVSPEQIIEAFREYIPDECLRDGEQNDSAEVLELLCSTVALEHAKQTSVSGRAFQQAQAPWKYIALLLSASLASNGVSASESKAVHNTVHPSACRTHSQASTSGSRSCDPDCTTHSFAADLNRSPGSNSPPGEEAGPQYGRLPLEGSTVNDMMCTRCQHSFVSQHSPFFLLPLALPRAKVTSRHGSLLMQRTAVAHNTRLQQCLAEFCSLEMIRGVHCPRCTLQSALQSASIASNLPLSSSTQPSAAAPAPTNPSTASHAAASAQSMQEASSHNDPRSSALPPWAGAEEATESSAEADAAPSCESRTADTTQAGATPYDETAATAEADASSDGPTTAACNASADQSAAEPHSAEAAELGGDSSAVTDVCVPTETQVQKRSIIEKLLRSTAPWPDTDYQQLARDAGLQWNPVGSTCIKRISLGRVPTTLCLHLRRALWTTSGRHVKLSGHVKFPLSFSISPYSAANKLPLLSLGQQYVPNAVQTQWIGSGAASVMGSEIKGTDSGFNGTPRKQGPVDAAEDDEDADKGRSRPGDAPSAKTLDGDVPVTTEQAAKGSRDAPSGSGNALTAADALAQQTTSAASSASEADAESAQQSVTSGSSSIQPEASIAKSGNKEAPTNGALMQSSARQGAAAAADAHDSRTGQIAAAGPVQRMLASHALSLASSLTSESSLLDEEILKKAAGAAEADAGASCTTPASASETEGQRKRSAADSGSRGGDSGRAGPLQRVLASHALSLASSLVSEGSMRDDEGLEDAPSHSVSEATQVIGHKAKDPQVAAAEVSDHAVLGAEDDPHEAASTAADAQHGAQDSKSVPDGAGEDSQEAASATAAQQAAGADLSGTDKGQDQDCPTLDPQITTSNQQVSPCPTEPMDDRDGEDRAGIEAGTLSKEHAGSSSVQSKDYHLTAAVVHHGGGSGGGHYTVYRRVIVDQGMPHAASKHAQWFSISDERVHKADLHDVLACEATLLMYER